MFLIFYYVKIIQILNDKFEYFNIVVLIQCVVKFNLIEFNFCHVLSNLVKSS